MGYPDLFPGMDMAWHAKANKQFASPFVDSPYDRISVDSIILAHAAVSMGYTIRDFYEKPTLGIHCVQYASQMYDLLPVTHWFFSLPWVTELGLTLEYKDTLPPISTGPIISDPSEVDKLEVPDINDLKNGWTLPMFFEIYDYVQKNLPLTLVPISYGFDMVGAPGELCGVENFIMWTFTEPEVAEKLVKIYADTSVNGAVAMAERYGFAMLTVGSVLANNDIFDDESVRKFSAKTMRYYVDKSFRGGAGPQLFYHFCGNHQTDYKVFPDELVWSPFTVVHIGYKGKDVFPSDLLMDTFGTRATIMGSVDTKIMINPNPKAVYDQSVAQLLKGRDSPNGYILGNSCECPPYTIPGCMHAMVQAARDHGTYGTW
jgi:uroporphyrinogen decarboxylase